MAELHYQDEAEWRELRKGYLTSTETPALFGFGTWITPYALYHLKRTGQELVCPEDDRMSWGKRLEPVIAQAACEQLNWTHRPADVFVTADGHERIGCSLDFYCEDPERGSGILECKNRDWLVWKNGWPPEKVAPEVYIQVQTQLLCTGFRWATVACLVGGNDLHIYPIERDERVIEQIIARATEFWRRVEAEDPFPIQGLPCDEAVINLLWGDTADGVIERDDLDLIETARMLVWHSEQRASANKGYDHCKAILFDVMQDKAELRMPGATVYRNVTKRGVRINVRINEAELPDEMPFERTTADVA